MQAEDFWILLTLLVTLVQCTVQDTLSCGSTTFQVTFEPSRPVVGSGGSAKFLYQPLDQLLGSSTVNMCNLSIAQIANEPRIAPTTLSTERRLVITRCENCSLCPGEIPSVHRVLTRVANELSLQSLLVIVHRNLDALKVDNTLVKFVFMEDDDPGSLTLCEIGDPGDGDALRSFSKTSVLFVSISFIILMVISLAWLVFYYVQRFRYAHAKDRLQRRLFNAAKKALTRIPTKPVKSGDKELDSDCPVCIDPYRAGDIVRCLPCRHVFHKTCVDPWLLEHRTCPMCKSDILKAFGYHVNVSGRRRTQFSAQVEGRNGGRGIEHDRISMDGHSSASESNAYPFPVVSEIHDPFSFTTAPAPQVVQVMHTTNVRGFSIIPLTVHNSGSMPSGPGASYTKVNASVERHTVVPTVHEPSDFVQSPSTSRSDRLLRTPTHRSSRKRRGHVVNLVHVRSRSLSQTQFPPTVLSNFASDRPTALFRSQSKDQPDGVPTGKPISPPVEIVDAGADDILGIVVDDIRPHSSKEGSLRDTRFTSVKPPARTRSALSNAKRHAGGIVRGQSAKVSRVSSEQHEDPHDDEDFFVQTPPSVFQAVQQSGSDPRNAVVAPELPRKPVPFSDTISVESL